MLMRYILRLKFITAGVRSGRSRVVHPKIKNSISLLPAWANSFVAYCV